MERRGPNDWCFRRREGRWIEHEWPRLWPTEPTVTPNEFFEGGDFAGGRVNQAIDEEVRRIRERVRPFQVDLCVFAKGRQWIGANGVVVLQVVEPFGPNDEPAVAF